MMKFSVKNGLLLCAGFLGLFSCKDDLNLSAPYEEITVVYGFIDPNSSENYVKVNKAFLGDGNAYAYAAIRDSLEYDTSRVEVKITKVSDTNWSEKLVAQEFSNKEAGEFYGPEHTLWALNANDLVPGEEYELKVTIDDETPNKKVLTSSAFLPAQPSIVPPLSNSILRIDLINSSGYEVYALNWKSGAYGTRYDAKVRIVYEEHYNDGSSETKDLFYNLGSVTADGLSGGQTMTLPFYGQQFFEYVGSQLSDPGTTIRYRAFKGMYFVFDVAGQELDTYMEVNKPISQVFQERPEYTNIENGLGVFSGRVHLEVGKRWFGTQSFEELCTGKYTRDLKICSDSLALVVSNSPDCNCDNL